MNRPLSYDDISYILQGQANIILYEQIHNFKTMDDLLGPTKACVILFQTRSPTQGHWCCIFLRKKSLEFFDPYGTIYDDNLKKINSKLRRTTYQDYPYLTKLSCDSKYKLEYNEWQFQRYSKNIQTCGYHCCTRIIFKHLTLNQYKKIFYGPGSDTKVVYVIDCVLDILSN